MPETDPLSEIVNGGSNDALVERYALANGVDPELGRRLVRQESRGRSRAVSPKGAMGLAQLMPATAKQMGVTDPFDVHQNLNAGMKYLRQQLDTFGDPHLALAAYNAGPGAVQKHGNKIPPYKETQNYVKTIGTGYSGTGYAQDPLSEITSGKTTGAPRTSDPLTEATTAAVVTPPVTPQKSQIAPSDRQWHVGVTPDEYSGMTRRQKRAVDAVTREGKTSDDAKRVAGQTEFTPDANYQNQNRAKAGLKIQVAPNTRDVLGLPQPIAPQLGANILPKARARDEMRPEIEKQVRAERAQQKAFKSIGIGAQIPIDLDPRDWVKSEDDVVKAETDRRLAEQSDNQDWLAANKAEIDRQTEEFRKGIKEQGGVNKWLAEVGAQGAAGLSNLIGGGLKRAGEATGLLTGNTEPTDEAADKLRIAAEAAQRAAVAEGADRNEVSKFAQNIGGGLISSLPSMAAMAAGVPAPIAFGAQGALEASGKGANVKESLKAGGRGAAQGAMFEMPVPGATRMIPRALTKAAMVGAGTAGIDVAAGQPLSEALRSGAVNAAMAGAGEAFHGAPQPEVKSLTEVPPIDDILAARESGVKPYANPRDRIAEIESSIPGAKVLNPAEVMTGAKPRITIKPQGVEANAVNEGIESSDDISQRQGVNSERQTAETSRRNLTEQRGQVEPSEAQNVVDAQGTRANVGAPEQVSSQDRIVASVVEFGGGPEALTANYTDEGMRKALKLHPDVPLGYMEAKGYIEKNSDGTYRLSDEIQSRIKRVNPEGAPQGQVAPLNPNRRTMDAQQNPEGQSVETKAAGTVVFDSSSGRRAVDLPDPPPAGTVRVYRGEPLPSQESYGTRGVKDAPDDLRGRWFTTDPQEAADYAAANDVKGGGVTYVDIPAAELEGYRAKVVATGRKFPFPLRDNEFILPPELAQKGVGVPSREAAESEQPQPYERQSSAIESPRQVATETRAPAKERSFPKTLELGGREKGADLTYESKQRKGVGGVEEKARTEALNDLEKVRNDVMKSESPSSEFTAKADAAINELQRHIDATDDPVAKNELKMQQIDVASHAARQLTSAGQMIEAAKGAKERYTPSGALMEATRIVKMADENAKLSVKDASEIDPLAKQHEELQAKLTATEKELAEAKAQLAKPPKTTALPKKTAVRQKIETLDSRLAQLETEARERLAARVSVGKGSEAGASTIPLDIADYAIIGATKLARKGTGALKSAEEWYSEMRKEFGEDIEPHLDKIFVASRQYLDTQKQAMREASAQRGAGRQLAKEGKPVTAETIADLRQKRSEYQAEQRQVRVKMDRKFQELQEQSKSKVLRVVTTQMRDNLLAVKGALKVLTGVGPAKQAIDMTAQLLHAPLDIAVSKLTGKPRAEAALNPVDIVNGIAGFAKHAPQNVLKVIMGEPSEVMPGVHAGVTGNLKADIAISPMMKLFYAPKEALLRTWTYEQQRLNFARTLALSEGGKASDLLSGRAELTTSEAKQIANELAKFQAKYELRDHKLDKKLVDKRIQALTDSPSELIHALALQASDRAVYAQPNWTSDAINAAKRGLSRVKGGKAAADILESYAIPFVKRPTNSITDTLTTYTGLRIPLAAKRMIDSNFSAGERRAFYQAISRPVTGGIGVVGLGMALHRKGLLTPAAEDEKTGTKNVWTASGYQPGALKVGGRYWQVGTVPVVGWLLTAGASLDASLQKTIGQPSKDRAAAASVAIAKGFGRMVSEHPLLRGPKELLETIGEVAKRPEGAGKMVKKELGKLGARLVPSPIAMAAEASDDKERDYRPSVAPITSRIPGVRQMTPARKDIMGRDVEKSRLSVIDPFRSTADKSQPFLDELMKQGVGISESKKKDGEEEGEYKERVKREAAVLNANAPALNALVQSSDYRRMSSEERQKYLKGYLAHIKIAATPRTIQPLKPRRLYPSVAQP